MLAAAHVRAALGQSWPPFVLVAGLLLLGQLAGRDGLFDAAASRLVRVPGEAVATLLACLALVALVTALLNLDTAVVFLTPVLLGVAERRRLDPSPFLYGAIFMANASSLFLPGSNLTNLLVLAGAHRSGGSFLTTMLPAAGAAVLATAVGLLLIHRRALAAHAAPPALEPPQPIRVGPGLIGAVLAAALIVALQDPALPVLGLAVVLLAWSAARGRLDPRRALAALGAPTLLVLFALSVALGVLARSGAVSLGWLHDAGAPATAGVAALSTVLINNLPSAVLLSSTGHLQAQALLIGLNVGPNLAVTGSLAVLLWWRAARAAGATPSALTYSKQGLLLAPVAIALALLASSA
ncbi:MAG: Arsenic efflux pump protein [Solirubrobacterales bacterium]|nr:Arsenic efflux pump protein [Solirubrobacterales bacterium]